MPLESVKLSENFSKGLTMIKPNKRLPLGNLGNYIFRKLFPIEEPPKPSNFKFIEEIELVPYQQFVDFVVKNIRFNPESNYTYLEFGVFNGNSLCAAFEAIKKVNCKNFTLIGFDSFQGLPLEAESEDAGVWEKGRYACSLSDAMKNLIRRGVDLKKIKIIDGWYRDTLTGHSASSIYEELGSADLILIDCDTYGSSKAVLQFVKPLLKPGSIICFDDWRLNWLDLYNLGEKQAFDEFLEQHDSISVKKIKSYNRKSESFVVKSLSKGSSDDRN